MLPILRPHWRLRPDRRLIGAALVLARPVGVAAHEIPGSVHIFAFVRPEGRTLRLLVRVPIEAMRDVSFGLRGPGFLELNGIDPMLHDAARLWITDDVQLFEDG